MGNPPDVKSLFPELMNFEKKKKIKMSEIGKKKSIKNRKI
jgi:hypothetical protein